MKMFSNVIMTVAVFLIISVIMAPPAFCQQKNKPTSGADSADSKLKTLVGERETAKEILDKKAYDSYINGIIAEQSRDYLTAAKHYYNALQKYPESYEIRFSLAEVYYRLQRFQDAIRTLDTISPEDVNVHSLRAICFRSMGSNNAARDAYLKVIKVDSLNESAFSFLASEYRRMNMLDSVVWVYEHLVKIDSESPRLWSELGQFRNQQGRFAEAKEAYSRALALSRSRENVMAVVGLAESYRGLNQADSALVYYKEALTLDPNNSYLNRALAAYYSDLDSTDLAIQYAEKLTRLEPNNISALRYLALMYVRADSTYQAESLFRTLIEAGDNEPANYFYLGRIAIMRQEYEAAREYLTILTNLADTLVDGWLDLGYVYRMQGDTAKSINVYNSGLKFVIYREDSVRLMFAIGATLERSKKYKESEKTFEKLLKLDPMHGQSLNYLGYMLADRGERLNHARDLIKKALELSPDNAAYIDSYGWVMYRLGKYDSAVTYLEKAAEKESDPIVYDHLGDAYKAIGRVDDARIWWQKALELEPTNDAIREKLNE